MAGRMIPEVISRDPRCGLACVASLCRWRPLASRHEKLSVFRPRELDVGESSEQQASAYSLPGLERLDSQPVEREVNERSEEMIEEPVQDDVSPIDGILKPDRAEAASQMRPHVIEIMTREPHEAIIREASIRLGEALPHVHVHDADTGHVEREFPVPERQLLSAREAKFIIGVSRKAKGTCPLVNIDTDESTRSGRLALPTTAASDADDPCSLRKNGVQVSRIGRGSRDVRFPLEIALVVRRRLVGAET